MCRRCGRASPRSIVSRRPIAKRSTGCIRAIRLRSRPTPNLSASRSRSPSAHARRFLSQGGSGSGRKGSRARHHRAGCRRAQATTATPLTNEQLAELIPDSAPAMAGPSADFTDLSPGKQTPMEQPAGTPPPPAPQYGNPTSSPRPLRALVPPLSRARSRREFPQLARQPGQLPLGNRDPPSFSACTTSTQSRSRTVTPR